MSKHTCYPIVLVCTLSTPYECNVQTLPLLPCSFLSRVLERQKR